MSERKPLLGGASKKEMKTDTQKDALEVLYNEERFPQEHARRELADQIGLSEKAGPQHAQNRKSGSRAFTPSKSLQNGYTHGAHHRCAATP